MATGRERLIDRKGRFISASNKFLDRVRRYIGFSKLKGAGQFVGP